MAGHRSADQTVQRRHQLGDEALVQRVRLDGPLQLGKYLPRAQLLLFTVEQLVHRLQSAGVELHR